MRAIPLPKSAFYLEMTLIVLAGIIWVKNQPITLVVFTGHHRGRGIGKGRSYGRFLLGKWPNMCSLSL